MTTRFSTITLCLTAALFQSACSADLEAEDGEGFETSADDYTAKDFAKAEQVGTLEHDAIATYELPAVPVVEVEQHRAFLVDAVEGEALDIRIRRRLGWRGLEKTEFNAHLVDAKGAIVERATRQSVVSRGVTLSFTQTVKKTGTYYVVVTYWRHGKVDAGDALELARDVPFDAPAAPVDVSGMTAHVTVPLEASFFGPCQSTSRPPKTADLTLRVEGKVPGKLTVISRSGQPAPVSPDGHFVFSGPFGAGAGVFEMAGDRPALPLVAKLRAGYGGMQFTCTAFNRHGGWQVRTKNPVTVTFSK